MPIKITNSTLDLSMKAIEAINKTPGILAVVSFKLGALKREAKKHLPLYLEKLEELTDKHTEKNDKGEPVPFMFDGKPVPNVINLVKATAKQFHEEKKALGDIEVEINLNTMKVSDLGKDICVEGWILSDLYWFFTE